MATISNTPRPGYVWDSTDNVWYPIGVGAHQHTNAADTPAVMPYSTYAAAGKNKFINGDFSIWQRGASFTANGYTADRWNFGAGGTGTSAVVTRQNFTPNAAPVAGYEGAYFYQVVTTPGSDTSSYITFEQNVEDPRTFAGQTMTVSFWARATSGTPKVGLELIQQSGGTGTNIFVPGSTTKTISTSWARYSFTITVPTLIWTSAEMSSPSGGGKLTFNFWLSNGSALATRSGNPGLQANTFQFWGMQAEAGSTVTAFQTATGNPASELAACQRYFYRHEVSGTVNTSIGAGGYYAGNTYLIPISFPVTMRVAPTFAIATVSSGYQILRNGGLNSINDLTMESANTRVAQCYNNTQASGTIGFYGQLTSQNASTSLAWSAEL